jgi:hypothetical protein
MSIETFGAEEGRGGSARSWREVWKRRRGGLRMVRRRHCRRVKVRDAVDIVSSREVVDFLDAGELQRRELF